MNPLGFRQCRLHKETESGTRVTVTWLPLMYAQVGKVVKLKSESGDWEDGWTVVTVSDTIRTHLDLYNGRDPKKVFPSLKDEKKRKQR